MAIVLYAMLVFLGNIPSGEFVSIIVNRKILNRNTLSQAFYHAKDTFTNPREDPIFCKDRKAICENYYKCETCACKIDDTLLSLDRGCVGRSEAMQLSGS